MRLPAVTSAVVLALAASFTTSSATVIHVLPDGSGEVPTIRDALAIAVFGDTIALGDGVFHEHDLPLKSGVTILSDSGDPASTAIDAGSAGRCLSGISVTGAPAVRGITFQNGTHPQDGGLLLAGHNNVRFLDCVFRNGVAPRGGAVALTDPASYGHAPVFDNCRFESNRATTGGAVWSAGIGRFVNAQFTGNTALGSGGAVYCRKDSGWGVWLQECRFERNTAGGDGGAVYSAGLDAYLGTSITQCEFVANAAARGGAARLEFHDYAAGSTFVDNRAGDSGGALYLLGVQVDEELDQFVANLFAGNQAHLRGGAIAASGSGGFVTLTSSTLSGNTAPEGAHLWSDGAGPWGEMSHTILAFGAAGAAASGTGTFNAGCSDVYGNAGGDFTGPLSGQGSINGNFSADPLFCGPAAGDYTLRQGSPCFPAPAGCAPGAIGTYGIGCTTSTSVASQQEPESVTTLENTPEPFRESTTISYVLPVPSPVRIEIYDALGHRVTGLVHDVVQPAGTHAVEWGGSDADGRRVPPGLYFCRLEAQDIVEVRKIVRIR